MSSHFFMSRFIYICKKTVHFSGIYRMSFHRLNICVYISDANRSTGRQIIFNLSMYILRQTDLGALQRISLCSIRRTHQRISRREAPVCDGVPGYSTVSSSMRRSLPEYAELVFDCVVDTTSDTRGIERDFPQQCSRA